MRVKNTPINEDGNVLVNTILKGELKMGKVINKVDLENKTENQEEAKMENKPENNDAQGVGVQIQLVPPKAKEKKGLLDIIWRDRGIFGKTVTVTLGTVTITGLVFAVKALVAVLFGPEAAEMIDPSMIAPTEE